MLVNGIWTKEWHPVQKEDETGRFLRQPSSVRNWITPDGTLGSSGQEGFAAASGRYHLYAALICPWACRALIVRKLLGLEQVISLSIVSPVMSEQGWQFGHYPGATEDHLYHSRYLHEVYTRHDARYSGRATVPVLWDKQENRMVNNESADIIRILNSAFVTYAQNRIDLYPEKFRPDIDQLNSFYYEKLNNGVYRAGFATSQIAYEEAYDDVFAALDDLDKRLEHGGPYILGSQLTETDIRLFVTLIRFDVAYYGVFKCNRNRIADYQYISAYIKRLYTLPGISETVDFDHIKRGYYSLKALNPSGIVPKGPEIDLVA